MIQYNQMKSVYFDNQEWDSKEKILSDYNY